MDADCPDIEQSEEDEDSCEANADERESLKSCDLNEQPKIAIAFKDDQRLKRNNFQKNWDHFSPNESQDEDIYAGLSYGQSESVSQQQSQYRFASPSDKPSQHRSVRMNTARLGNAAYNNTDKRPSIGNIRNDILAKAELQRLDQFEKPMFLLHGSKASLDSRQLHSQTNMVHLNNQVRNTLCSPDHARSNFFSDEHAIGSASLRKPTARNTFNFENTRDFKGSFLTNSRKQAANSPNYPGLRLVARQNESPDNQRFSVQQLPQSRLSERSLIGKRDRNTRFSRSPDGVPRALIHLSSQQPSYQYQSTRKLINAPKMVEKSNPNRNKQLINSARLAQERPNQQAQPVSQQDTTIRPYLERQTERQVEPSFTVICSNMDEDRNSPQLDQATTSRAMPRNSLQNKNMVQIDKNYFDHLRLPDSDQSNDEVSIIDTHNAPNLDPHALRLQQSSQASNSIFDGRPSATTRHQRNNSFKDSALFVRKQSQTRQSSGYPLKAEPAHQIGSESPTINRSCRNLQQPVQAMNTFKRSFQDQTVNGFSEAQSFTNDVNSAGNLISMIKRPALDTPTANSSLHLQLQSINAKEDFTPSGDGVSSTNEYSYLERPIVARDDYFPTINDVQSQMMGSNQNMVEEAEGLPDQSNVGWFTSLTLSVSQLFTGPTDPNADPLQNKDRKMSNGEVPVDEEESEVDRNEPNQNNKGVRLEQTRVCANQQVHKKILLMESSVPAKGAISRRKGDNRTEKSFQQQLLGAQSYNQIESGSEVDDDSGSEAYQLRKEREKVISYTTSKHAGDTFSKESKAEIANEHAQQRQHSTSMHEKLNNLGTSFSNLASSLMNKGRDTPQFDHRDIAVMSPQPRQTKHGEEESKIGVIGRLLERVTKTNQKQQEEIAMSLNRNDENEDFMSYEIDDVDSSPVIRSKIGNSRQADESSDQKLPQVGARGHSKTMTYEQRPLLQENAQKREISQPQEKLRQIDSIVYNQDKSHFAVIWTDGGFTKFDVATLQMVQRVLKTPEFDKSTDYQQHGGQIDQVDDDDDQTNQKESNLSRIIGRSMQMPRNHQPKKRHHAEDNISGYPSQYNSPKFQPLDIDSDDQEAESEMVEQFECLALQHRTNDYLATLVTDPKMVIFVHILKQGNPIAQQSPPKTSQQQPTTATQAGKQCQANKLPSKNNRLSHLQNGVRTHAKHFCEVVTRIEILPESRFTVICLQTSIYIYRCNTQELYDIVPCSFSSISSAIYKNHEQKIVLAYLSKDDPGETLLVHDYSVNPQTGSNTLFQIAKPFSSGYKIGGIQLDALGQRVVVVSSNGCYVYLYCLEQSGDDDKSSSTSYYLQQQVGQDHATPEYGISSDAGQDFPSSAASYQNHQHTISIKSPQQTFFRSSSSCKQIYLPIQIVEGFSIEEHTCDFILLSSSSMTTHMFVVKTAEELIEQKLQQNESSWVSRFLPSNFTSDRSKIRLNIQQELAPVETPNYNSVQQPDKSRPAGASPIGNQGANVYKQQTLGQSWHQKFPNEPVAKMSILRPNSEEYPYMCFIEQSGLMVVISHQGYCCKFSIDLQNEMPSFEKRYSDYNSGVVRQSRHYSPGQRGSVQGLGQADLSTSLALLTSTKSHLGRFSRQNSKNAKSPTNARTRQNNIQQLNNQRISVENLAVSQNLGNLVTPDGQTANKTPGNTATQNAHNLNLNHHLLGSKTMPNSLQNSQVQLKKATAFSGYKQAQLRLKFKMQDFFIKVDRKEESRKRIRKRQLIEERTLQYKEHLLQLHQSKACSTKLGDKTAGSQQFASKGSQKLKSLLKSHR